MTLQDAIEKEIEEKTKLEQLKKDIKDNYDGTFTLND